MAIDKIRVLIVDDIAETRENVRKLLQFETDVDVAGTARSGKEGIQLAQELDPDVVLMDINMNPISGFEATEKIRKVSPASKIIGVSMHSQPAYAKKMLQIGAFYNNL